MFNAASGSFAGGGRGWFLDVTGARQAAIAREEALRGLWRTTTSTL